MQVRGQELFSCVRTEGALLPPEVLRRIADGDRDLPGLRPDDYHLVPGETLGEAVNRAWARLVGGWAAFRSALAAAPPSDPATTLTRERWLLVLMAELGYGRLPAAAAVEVDGRSFPVSHGWGQSPLHLVGARVDLDRRTPGVAGAARQSPHSLVQELLNADDSRLWGMASNGLALRVLRDNAQLTRQAYVEFDLQAMMDGEVYSDFALLWLVCHQSRVEGERPEHCWLERWSAEAAERGARARESLRQGVEQAIATLGTGLLAHPDSTPLRLALRDGTLAPLDFYRQMLRLVYRLIFLFVAEDRDALLDPGASPEARARYLDHYSTARLRRLAARRRGGRHPDLWRALRLVMRRLGADEGAPGLALPALGSALWDERRIADVMGAEIANRDLLQAVRDLAFVSDRHTLRPVDYRNLGAEELGSVYESLLELHPELNVDAPSFALSTAAGSERKTTGAYYTPTSLIVELLDSALDPVLGGAAQADDPEAAILALKVCDPACGSGHFLIAAAQRIAMRLAAVRTGDAEPAPAAVRAALRDVVGRCVYGVDVSEMAVELCKVALWMEAIEPGRPLSFLDHRIVVGNSLLGTTPALVSRGVPDAAFTALLGDDRTVVAALKKHNRAERGGQTTLLLDSLVPQTAPLASELAALEATPDDDILGVHERERRYRRLVASEAHERARWAANAWCAAFVCAKGKGEPEITTATVRQLASGPDSVPERVRARIAAIASAHRFHHWHVAFPDVFTPHPDPPDDDDAGWTGGFDVVLGNPPWERIKLQEKEWFATRSPEIALAANKAARERLLKKLPTEDPPLWEAWQGALRQAEGESHMVRRTGRFPLCGRGDVNTYSIFAETMRTIVAPRGRVGCIVPSGIATDDTTKHFFGDLMRTGTLVSLFGFENEEFLFPGVDHRVRFALVTMRGDGQADTPVEFVFFARQTSWLRDPERRVVLTASDLALLNPNTLTCPTFRSGRDAEVARRIYARVPVLLREGPPEQNPWGVDFMAMFHMANDAHRFRRADELTTDGWHLDGNVFRKGDEEHLPLYEAKMLRFFDHRYGTYEGQTQAQANQGTLPRLSEEQHADPGHLAQPRYWVDDAAVDDRLSDRWDHGWLLAWRDIARSTDERTLIASVLPRGGAGDKAPLVLPSGAAVRFAGCLLANLTSLVFDYVARTKVGGSGVKFFIVKQLPVFPPTAYADRCAWADDTLDDWVTARAVELTYTATDLAAFASDVGWPGPPFVWSEARRAVLRADLDAAYFHLYDLPREDVEHVMDGFPVVRQNDERAHGEPRTRRLILEAYDAMAEAIATGSAYETPLDPPPAHESMRHPARSAAPTTTGGGR